jgi:hypothetical protein
MGAAVGVIVLAEKFTATGTYHHLMEVVVRIAIAVIDARQIEKVIVATQVNSCSGSSQTFPEGIAFVHIVVKIVGVKDFEGRFVAENKDVRAHRVGCPLLIEPRLVDSVQVDVLVQPNKQGIFVAEGVSQVALAGRAVGREQVSAGKSRVPSLDTDVFHIVFVIAPDRIDADSRAVERCDQFFPRRQLRGVGAGRSARAGVGNIAGKERQLLDVGTWVSPTTAKHHFALLAVLALRLASTPEVLGLTASIDVAAKARPVKQSSSSHKTADRKLKIDVNMAAPRKI